MKRLVLGHFFFLLFSCALAAAPPARSNTPARLAVISNDAKDAQLADLLALILSQRKGLQLLEREQLEKVYREQGLSAAMNDYLKLGHILSADGLVLITHDKDAGNEAVQLRLVAVDPGVVIGSLDVAKVESNNENWVNGLADYFQPLFPKLKVLAKDALPLSIVNFHAAFRSAAEESFEKQLTLLATERLVHEPNIFVLERRRMDLLASEKALEAVPDSPFWNGGYLVEGVIDRDGFSPDTVTVNLQLVPAKGGTPIVFECRGSRTNLNQLVENLTARLRTELKLTPNPIPWNPEDEAKRFFEEGKWAYKWELYPQAAAACESSFALGQHSPELVELRIRSYLDDAVDYAQAQYTFSLRLLSFASRPKPVPGIMPELPIPIMGSGVPPKSDRLSSMRRAMELYCEAFPLFADSNTKTNWDWYALGLQTLQNASLWLCHYYYTPEARPGHEAILNDLQTFARAIDHLLGDAPQFANFRARPGYSDPRQHYGPGVPGGMFAPAEDLPELEGRWAGYWGGTPEEGITVYRAMLKRGHLALLRRFLADRDFLERSSISDPLHPQSGSDGGTVEYSHPLSFLCGWKWADRARAQAVWRQFIEELSHSSIPAERFEGLYLCCAHALTDPEHDRLFRELLSFLEQNMPVVAAAPGNDALTGDMDVLVYPRMRVGFQPAALEKRRALWEECKRRLSEVAARAERDRKLSEQRKFLAGDKFDFPLFLQQFPPMHPYTTNEALALLPAVATYRTNLAARMLVIDRQLADYKSHPTPENSQAFGKSSLERLNLISGVQQAQLLSSWLETILNGTPPPATASATPPGNTAAGPQATYASGFGAPHPPFGSAHNPPPGPNPMLRIPGPGSPRASVPFANDRPIRGPGGMMASGGPFASAPRAAVASPGTDPGSLSLTNVLEVRRFWVAPQQVAGTQGRVGLMILDGCYREGRLWLDTRFDQFGQPQREMFFNRGAILAVDLDSFQSEVFPLDPTQFNLSPRNLSRSKERSFEVHDGWLYVSSTDQIKRLSLKEKRWEDVPVPVHGHARFSKVGERLFLSTEESIVELGSDGRQARLVASARRRPAVNSLDALPTLGAPPLLAGPAGSLVTLISGQWYDQSNPDVDWHFLLASPALERASCFVGDDGILAVSHNSAPNQLFALFKGLNTPQLLLTQEVARPYIPGRPLIDDPRHIESGAPLWPLPEGVHALDYPLCLDGRALWVFAGHFISPFGPRASPRPELGTLTDFNAVLFRLQPGVRAPFELALRFRTPGVHPVGGMMMRDEILLQQTPKGLVVASSFVPGFWLIPQLDLTRQLDAWSKESKAAQSAALRQ